MGISTQKVDAPEEENRDNLNFSKPSRGTAEDVVCVGELRVSIFSITRHTSIRSLDIIYHSPIMTNK